MSQSQMIKRTARNLCTMWRNLRASERQQDRINRARGYVNELEALRLRRRRATLEGLQVAFAACAVG